MAIESSRVRADVVQVQEYPQLARAYRVMGVPNTVINDTVQFAGAVTEAQLLQRILEAVGEVEPQDEEQDRISDQTSPLA